MSPFKSWERGNRPIFPPFGEYDLLITPFSDSDDHGNEAESATALTMGADVESSIDYLEDSDFFRFHAEKGNIYGIAVTVPMQDNFPEVRLYDSKEIIDEGKVTINSYRTLSQIRWEPEETGEYYASVEFRRSSIGPFNFHIEEFDLAMDDHGDSIATATDILLDSKIDGTINHNFDTDVFRLKAESGRQYKLRFEMDSIDVLDVDWYAPDGKIVIRDDPRVLRLSGTEFALTAPDSADYYFVATSLTAPISELNNLGTYTLMVTAN